MAKFKLKPPKPPKRPKVVNPMKGVNRARTLFITSLLGFAAFLTAFVFIYKSIAREGSQFSKMFSKSKARQSAQVPAATDGQSGVAAPELGGSGSTTHTSAALTRSAVQSSGSTVATPVPMVVNSPRITPTFEDPVCFWGKKGIARSRRISKTEREQAEEYLNKATSMYKTESSDPGCLQNAQSALGLLKKRSRR